MASAENGILSPRMRPKDGRNGFVLAIDDDETVRELYEEQLPILGYDVRCAADETEAKTALAARRPDVILMDIMMGGKDGLSLTREFRADARTADIPIIVVSGLTDAAALSDALLAGATDFLTKPFELDTLRGKLERVSQAAGRRKAG